MHSRDLQVINRKTIHMNENLWEQFAKSQKWRWLGLMVVSFTLIATVTYLFAYQYFEQEAKQQADNHAQNGRSTLLSISQQHTPLLYALSLSTQVHEALDKGTPPELNQHLLTLTQQAGLEAIYLMDTSGLTIAASNYQQNINYIGKNYSFRPYFKQALAGNNSDYFAIGATTGKPGYFISQPVFNLNKEVIGVLATKVSVSSFFRLWPNKSLRGFVTNKDNAIILASDEDWLYHTLNPLSDAQLAVIKAQKQFANIHLTTLNWTQAEVGQAEIQNEAFLYAKTTTLNNGWQLHMLVNTNQVKARSLFATSLISTAIFFLWAWALVVRSKRLKQALHNSEVDRQQLVTVNQQMQKEIGERITAESKLAKAQRQLVQSSRMAALGQLSASVIHELGQPLSALKTYIAAAEMSSPTPQMESFLGNLQRVTERMQTTTDELRLFSRPGDVTMEQVRLKSVIDKALSLIENSLNDPKPIAVKQHCDSTACVIGHPHRIEQVITNLLTNAIAALANTNHALIDISIKEEANNWVIEIADNGPGFGIRDPERLFEAFYTTKSDQQGMGLGLAISAAIVEEHHGKIWAALNPNGGAIFFVSLPKTNEANTP